VNERTKRVEAARGVRPLDLLIENVRLMNVYTGEVYPAEVGVSDGVIVYAAEPGWKGPEPAQRYDGQGKFAVPGLIDSHVHIESSMMSPARFAEAVLPHGTTTIVTDPHEVGNVFGLRGVRYMLDATAGLPLRVFVQAPSCVPSVPGVETAGADFGPQEIAELLSWDRVIGLAEVMDYVAVIRQTPRMAGILAAAHDQKKVISGHCPGLRGQDLAAYLVGGPESDHEGVDEEELIEKLRAGMSVEGRVSSFSESMSIIGRIYKRLGRLPTNLVLCTDDDYPNDIYEHGQLDATVRGGIQAGIPAIDVVRASTLNAALRHRLYDQGAIAPGKRADLLLTANLDEFIVDEVFAGGRLVAKGGKMLDAQRLHSSATTAGLESENSIHLPHAPRTEDYVLKARPGKISERIHVMRILTSLVRLLEEVELPVRGGLVDYTADPELALVSIQERHGKTGGQSLSLTRGLDLARGAVGSTVEHDCHNLLVAGRSAADMAVVAQALAECGGGFAAALDGHITALVPLPIAGLMSQKNVAEMSADLSQLNDALHALGMTVRQPLSLLLSLALPVIPQVGLTDLGLVDVAQQKLIPFWIDEA
jgi:adenine deaminase